MNNISTIIDKYPKTSVAVVGDLCLDMYYFLSDEKSEISVETGIRTRPVSTFKHEAGGAGNVAVNLKTVGASQVDIYGVVGSDPFGTMLKTVLEEAGVNCSYIQRQESNWNTHVYHKVYKESREEPRYDIGNFNKIDNRTAQSLLNDLESHITDYQAVIINEQIIHGFHSEFFQAGLSELIEKYEDSCYWISDCRHLNSIYNRTIRKLNIHEAYDIYKKAGNSDKTPSNSSLIKWLYSRWKKPVIITLGEEGAIAIDQNGEIERTLGINLIGQIDTVGAGDAFLSGAALTLASGGSVAEAVTMGNLSGNVSVTKLFETGHPTTAEIVEMGASPDYRYNPELANDERKALFLGNSDIELINLKKTKLPKVVIFDHDGTISTLRQGWAPIMQDVAVEAVLGGSGQSVPVKELNRIKNAVSGMIEKTTGIQTVIQMHHVRDLVRSCGFVSEENIMEPLEYKQIFNKKLLKLVDRRIELFKQGRLDLNDLTIKGSIQFLEILKKAGVKMYLASGTDQQDVRKEAAVLGYDTLFDGRIFGSVGDVSRDPKRIVIETIIESFPDDIRPEECYVFGDGPVEMREAAKHGFTRIGLVSDEKQRFGINPEKRSRLISGGAQALLPDFSWISLLIEYMEWDI